MFLKMQLRKYANEWIRTRTPSSLFPLQYSPNLRAVVRIVRFAGSDEPCCISGKRLEIPERLVSFRNEINDVMENGSEQKKAL